MFGWLRKRPWLFVVSAFVVLIIFWVVLLYLANKYRPDSVPMKPPTLLRDEP